MLVIGLSGKIGCGKSTLAELLFDKIPGGARLAFGDPVKTEVAQNCNIPLPWMYDQKLKLNHVPAITFEGFSFQGETVRERLQHYGTDFRRQQDPQYWTKAWSLLAQKLLVNHQYLIADDVRFLEEVNVLRTFSHSLLIRLEPYPGWEPGPHANHSSETQLDDYEEFDLRITPEYGGLDAVADQLMHMYFSDQE